MAWAHAAASYVAKTSDFAAMTRATPEAAALAAPAGAGHNHGGLTAHAHGGGHEFSGGGATAPPAVSAMMTVSDMAITSRERWPPHGARPVRSSGTAFVGLARRPAGGSAQLITRTVLDPTDAARTSTAASACMMPRTLGLRTFRSPLSHDTTAGMGTCTRRSPSAGHSAWRSARIQDQRRLKRWPNEARPARPGPDPAPVSAADLPQQTSAPRSVRAAAMADWRALESSQPS